MTLRVVVPPVVEPVTNAQAMLWCRAITADSALVDTLIQAARERAENTTQRVFVQRTMELTLPGFYDACDRSCLPPQITLAAPVLSVVSVKYLDLTGTEQTLSSAGYAVDTFAEPAVLRYATSFALPQVMTNRSDAVRVRFVAGYPPDLSDSQNPDYRKNLSAALLAWMQIQISTWYTQRESVESGGRLIETSRNFVEAVLDGLIVHTRFS